VQIGAEDVDVLGSLIDHGVAQKWKSCLIVSVDELCWQIACAHSPELQVLQHNS
jgi:hypothetical protein